jgi:hypothetical protein
MVKCLRTQCACISVCEGFGTMQSYRRLAEVSGIILLSEKQVWRRYNAYLNGNTDVWRQAAIEAPKHVCYEWLCTTRVDSLIGQDRGIEFIRNARELESLPGSIHDLLQGWPT